MSFGESIRTVWSKYAVFRGRARRSEFWWWALLSGVINAVCQILMWSTGSMGMLIGSKELHAWAPQLEAGTICWMVLALGTVIPLVLLLPSLGVSVRRLHDTGRSGWWLLLGLIPLADIVLLVFFAIAGSPGDNAYGPDPKAPPQPEAAPRT